MHHSYARCALLLVMTAVAACGGAQLRGTRSHEVQQAIRVAEDAGAADYPPAARLLAQARREAMLSQAKYDNGDTNNAALLLDRSEVDAQLALQLIQTRDQRESARATWAATLAEQLD
jgi:hypothetical protein